MLRLPVPGAAGKHAAPLGLPDVRTSSSLSQMGVRAFLQRKGRAARVRRALWARLFEEASLLLTAEGWARLSTRILHSGEIHQTAPFTWLDRYPDLFDLTAKLVPYATRILSFGCSSGEELISLRARFPDAEIVGAEINARSRAIARAKVAGDARMTVVAPQNVEGLFDIVFALSVLQRDPRGIAALVEAKHLAARYPFTRFDEGVRSLVARLRPGGLLCVTNALYRVEDSSVAAELEPIGDSPSMNRVLLGPEGGRLDAPIARTIFRKV
jgi:SAM-dependent methyltransferase